MKLICAQENLNQAITYLERVIGRQTSLPILGNFFLETKKGRLKISATNLEIGVIAYIGAKITEEGQVAIPAKVFANFIHILPKGDVLNLESDKAGLKIETTRHNIKIKGVDGMDFPIIPQFEKEYFFSFPAQELKTALSRTLFSVSVNNTRLELTGIHLFFFEKEIHLAATDSFRLAEEIIPLLNPSIGYKEFLQINHSLIIPSNTLYEILHILSPESTEVKIALEENQIFFEIDGVQVISRIINGKYPEYKQIIPKNFSFQCEIDKDDFQRSIRIASNFLTPGPGEITLTFDPSNQICLISSQSQEIGENKTTLPISVITGSSPLTIVFNPRYLLDGINVLSGEKVIFFANDGVTPVVLRMRSEANDTINEHYLYVIMPIKK